jgi:hypothetical protein
MRMKLLRHQCLTRAKDIPILPTNLATKSVDSILVDAAPTNQARFHFKITLPMHCIGGSFISGGSWLQIMNIFLRRRATARYMNHFFALHQTRMPKSPGANPCGFDVQRYSQQDRAWRRVEKMSRQHYP